MYEFVENGNLEQWLHGDVGPVSPLTWEARLNIAIGTAKGFVFLPFQLHSRTRTRFMRRNQNDRSQFTGAAY